MNTLNAEICASMGMDYRPPRGFENPLKLKLDQERVEEEKNVKTK